MQLNSKNGHSMAVDSVVVQQTDALKKIAASAGTPATTKSVQSVTKEGLQLQDCSYDYNTSSEILAGFKQKYPDAPTDLLEWAADDLGASAIAPDIALKNFTPVWDKKEIAKILEWKGYFDELGWVSGNLALLERQFKPKKPHTFEDRSTSKYLTCKKGYDAALLKGVDWDAIANDPTEPIVITEGAKKAASLIGRGYKAISLPGVDMGHPKGKRGVELVPGLDRLAVLGRPFILAFDSDITEKAEVQGALINLAAILKKKRCVVTVWTWPTSAGKGIDDVIVSGNFDRVSEINYKECTKKLEKQFSSEATEAGNNNKKKHDTDWADEIANIYLNKLAWDDNAKQWRQYGVESQGVWSVISDTRIFTVIKDYIQFQGQGCNAGKLSSIEKILRGTLDRNDWDKKPNIISYRDGVYDLNTNQLKPHSPSESDDWQKIDDWLNFVTQGKERDKNILIAYLAATLRGRADLHKVLLLTGPGGTGKSTFMRLAVDLIGKSNTRSSSLSDLSSNRFESANIYKKRLTIFPDENNKIRNVERFKKLTGQDPVPGEEKGKKGFEFIYEGMTIIGTNGSPFVDGLSAISRRLIPVIFSATVPESQRRDLNAEFQKELPAFSRYLLTQSNNWIAQVLKGTQDEAPMTSEVWEDYCVNNPMAAWLSKWLIIDQDGWEPIGDKKASSHDTQDDCITLYQSYILFCVQTNHIPVGNGRFSKDLLELTQVVLRLKTEKNKKRTGRGIQGLRLRRSSSNLDEQKPTYTEMLEQQEQLKNTPVTGNVTGGDGSVTGSVTAEVLSVTGCAGCDGQNATFSLIFTDDPKITEAPGLTNDTQIASQKLTKPEPEYTDVILTEIIESLCLCKNKETLMTLSQTYGLDDSRLKQRVWVKMTPAQRDKVKAIAGTETATTVKSSQPTKRWHGSSDSSKRDRLLRQVQELFQSEIVQRGQKAQEDIDLLIAECYGKVVPLENLGDFALEALLEKAQQYMQAKNSVVT